ncbi:Helix-turn-helix [Bradyrhizobium erythrophlei]|jgi:transcriptional regulator with XRE-family HTH domain|nr:Helix-turn-helix [Bradyrhizobium erythrophlei]
MVNGMQIAAARGWLGLSQAKLARRTKVGLRTIKHFEAGERIPYGRTIDALVAYLQKRGVEFLMQGDIGIGIKVVRIIEDEECEEEQDKKAKRKNSKAGGELAPNATDK